MPRKTQTIALSPWVGGLDVSQDPIILGLTPEGQQKLAVADNIIFTKNGGRKKRGGQARFNSSALNTGTTASTPCDALYATTYWYNNTSNTKTEELVVVADNTQVFYASSYGTLTSLTFSGVTPAFSHGQVTTEVMTEKLFIGWSKTQTAMTYSGGGGTVISATASTLVVGTFPAGHILRQHISRMFIAGDASAKDRLYYSASGLPFAYGTAGGYIDIYPGDGDPDGITAIFPSVNYSELYVAKRTAIYKIDTSDISPSNWAIIPVSKSIGCVNHNTAQAVDQGDIIFASDRGIHSLGQVLTGTGIIEGKFLSSPIQSDYDTLQNKTLMSAMWAPDLNSYLFSCQREGETSMETVYGYNVESGGWYRWTSVPCNFLFKRLNTSSGAFQYYSCGDSTSSSDRGYINKLQQEDLWDFSSSTGNIATTIKSVLLYPDGNFLVERNFLNVILLVRSRDESTIDFTVTIDEVLKQSGEIAQRVVGGNVLGTSTYLLGAGFILGAPTGAKPLFAHIAGVGNGIQVTIEHDTIGTDLEIYGLAVEYETAGESQDAYRVLPT